MAFGLSPKYSQSISLDGLTKEQFMELAANTFEKLNWKAGSLNDTSFKAFTKLSLSSWSEEIVLQFTNDLVTISSSSTGQLVDWGKNKKNVLLFIETFMEFKSNFFIGAYENNSPQTSTEYQPDVEQPILKSSPKEKLKNIVSVFIPTREYFITPILINLNILIFILMACAGAGILEPSTDVLIAWGANFRPVTLDGEAWRLLSCCFIHIGIIHLLMNMYALLYIGSMLEPYLGKTKFVVAYLATGIVASATSLWWHDLTVSAGASGAIFGMYGVFIALLSSNLIDKATRESLLPNILLFTGYNLLFGMKGGVDNAAHIGGLLSGIVIGFGYILSLKNAESKKLKMISLSTISFGALALCTGVYYTIPNDIATYDRKISEFSVMEDRALSYYNLPENTPPEKLVLYLKDTGLFYWNKGKTMLVDVDKLTLPELVHARNAQLINYCTLRIKCYELMCRSLEENTANYDSLIINYNNEIQTLVNNIK
jgi:rhomboid protease GluP